MAVIARLPGWVDVFVDCEGSRMAQIFSDCSITKYLSRATARRLCGRQTIAAVESLHSCYCLASSTHCSAAELPWTSRNTSRPPTVTSPVAHDRHRPSPRRTASIQAPAAATVLIGRTTVLQCCALLPVCLRFLHTVKHFRIVSYRIVSLMAVSCHH